MTKTHRIFAQTLCLLITVTLLLFFVPYFTGTVNGQQGPLPKKVFTLRFEGALTPITVEYIQRGIDQAIAQNGEAIILGLNTPGGSIDLMNQIVLSLRASPIPVIVFVSPRGAMAGSAGTIITLAGHLSAMAPETAIGAASPVGTQGEDIGETMEAKMKEILKATARSLAEKRGSAAITLAENTIENAKAASAQEAFTAHLVDFIAENNVDLLQQIDGKRVTTIQGERTLVTLKAQILPIDLTPIEQILQLLTNPNLVFLLLAIGVQAILIELSTPGGWVAGFIGVICLALATYGLGILPINWFGIIFIVLSCILFILDINAPTHGIMTAAGVASFICGALVLFNSPQTPDFQKVSVPLIIGVASVIGATFLLFLTLALRVLSNPVLTGEKAIIGRSGIAKTDIAPRGMVQVAGETWSAKLAKGEGNIEEGAAILVTDLDGLLVLVKRN